MRCALCGVLFTAPPPPEVGDKKYDESVGATLGVTHYRAGLTLNATAKLQADAGVPLAASTQSEILKDCAAAYKPVLDELERQAADGELFFLDDTGNRVIELAKESRAKEIRDEMLGKLGKDAKDRTGCFTTGIVSVRDAVKMALYKTGPLHAGENFTQMLLLRTPGLPAPLAMCDALDRNLPQPPPGMSVEQFIIILCRCLVHGRRGFADVAGAFPEEVAWVLRLLRKVYITDAIAREKGLSPQARLELHQKWSGPRMRLLRRWMGEQLAFGNAEPNSGLGAAIKYMEKNWEALTRFLTTPGAPLDNNFAERVLKVAIKHRLNSLFYRTMNGAADGDTHMSLIHTAELNGVSAQQYLLALLRNRQKVAERPGEWMPWNFQATLARLEAGPDPPVQAVRATPVQAAA
jgi:transposase